LRTEHAGQSEAARADFENRIAALKEDHAKTRGGIGEATRRHSREKGSADRRDGNRPRRAREGPRIRGGSARGPYRGVAAGRDLALSTALKEHDAAIEDLQKQHAGRVEALQADHAKQADELRNREATTRREKEALEVALALALAEHRRR